MKAIYIAQTDTKNKIKRAMEFAGRDDFLDYARRLAPDAGIPGKANIAEICSVVAGHNCGGWKRVSFKDAKPFIG